MARLRRQQPNAPHSKSTGSPKEEGQRPTNSSVECIRHDACKIIEEQGQISNIREGRIFPYNGHSVGTAFRRECGKLKIKDLHFHDLRHEGTSRLFEAGLPIEKVALVTGHKDWRQLQRYTHLKVEDLLKLQYAQQPSMEEFIETLAAS